MPRSLALAAAVLLAVVTTVAPTPVQAQSAPDLFVAAQGGSNASRRDVPSRRVRKARLNLNALNAPTMRLRLFDDVQPVLTRTRIKQPAADQLVWIGRGDNGEQAVLAMARGVMTGTVFADGRVFEIGLEPDGQYSIAEIDSAAFPTDDPEFEGINFEILEDPGNFVGDQVVAGADGPATVDALTGTPVQVDVMVVWTPSAELAAGGAAAMNSLALASIDNANLVYANSGVNAVLNLVYAGQVNYTENPASITTDLSNLRGTTDAYLNDVHAKRDEVGADIVTLFGEGYRNNGYCGYGGIMTTVSTSYAPYAFNVVDRSCAVSNLSFAHEVGHNQGLHHDPANASSAASTPYAYGYQDPAGAFRTLLSYGSATRVPYLSSPTLYYNGRVMGTSTQDNARALAANIATVAAFKSVGGTTTPTTPTTPTCSYSVSTTSLSFASTGGSKSVTVTATAGCSWSTANDAAVTWVGMSTGAGTGSGTVTVTTQANSSSARSTTITIAGTQIAVSQAAPKVNRRK
ncbi:reprolysin-like metallopeptidase [Luteitalea sp. TBR-22]|uniref:reprolysin-like metallopeptidase n=1 Tax=Luteitalea sp. TBR-22 TaxID=2802971 RepID=UPI001EF695B6|nr:M12 family metallo-peptidase [Luteitalea sp. TBR-22]